MRYGIIIPVYFGRPFIRRALDSVFAQEGISGSLSVFLIEDGTPAENRVEDLIAPYPVHYIQMSRNHGVFHTRVYGLAQLSNDVEFCAFLDQDDAWHPRFLATLTALLQKNDAVGLSASNVRLRTACGEQILYQRRHPSLRLEDLKVANQLISPSQVLIRRKALSSLQQHPNLPYSGADDWLLWLSILAQGYQGVYTPEVLVDYYDHEQGAHHNHQAIVKSQEYIVEHWFPYLGFSLWDQRLNKGRVSWDHIAVGLRTKNVSCLLKGLRHLIRDPVALNAARVFRRNHKLRGIV